MKHFQTLAGMTLLAVSLAPFGAVQAEKAIAKINGETITDFSYNAYGKARLGVEPGPHIPAQKRQELIEELINRELVYQDALSKGLDKRPDVKAMIIEQTKNVLTSSRIQQILENNPVEQSRLKAIYKEQVVAMASDEYKARHILLNTNDDAKSVIEKLMQGRKFEELAAEKSTGPSAEQGGDLGWFSLNQMVKPFADAVKKLKKGEYTQRPVKSQFGWHVILLEDKRKVDPPSMASMQEQIQMAAQNEILDEYISELRDKADISILK